MKKVFYLYDNSTSEKMKVWESWTAGQDDIEVEYGEATQDTLTGLAKRTSDEKVLAVYTGSEQEVAKRISDDIEGVTFTQDAFDEVAEYTVSGDAQISTRVQQKIGRLWEWGMHPKRISKKMYERTFREG